MNSILSFLFDVLQLFLSFKKISHLKIDQGIQILQLKKELQSKIIIIFFSYFLNVFIYI